MIRKRRTLKALAVALAFVLALAGVALVFADSAIPWRVFDSGGNNMSSTNYRLGSSAGQSSAIGQSGSTNFRLGAGYWYGAGCAHVVAGLCDTDGDGCPDVRERQTAIGSELTGGRRDPNNPWDHFDPEKVNTPHIQSAADIVIVVQHYGLNAGDPGYSTAFDRTALGPNLWNLGPPDGLIRAADILAAVKQFGHNCP